MTYNRNSETQEQRFKRDLTSFEKEQDFLKHLATLGTGSTFLLVTFYINFVSKLDHPAWKFLIVVSITSFTVSLLGCLSMQFFSILDMNAEIEPQRTIGFNIETFSVVSGFGGFLLGIIAIAIFFIKNI